MKAVSKKEIPVLRLNYFKKTGIDFLLLIIACFLYYLSFPNDFFQQGLFFLAFISLIPLFIAIHRAGPIQIFLYGAFFGYFSYFLINFWLGQFHPLTLLIVPTIFLIYYFFFFPVLKLLDHFFPDHSFILQTLAWIFFEYLKSIGFLGYTYGNIGYTQSIFTPLIQIASITGIWGVTFLVIFPSAFIGYCLKTGIKDFKNRLLNRMIWAAGYLILLIVVILFGFLSQVDLKTLPTSRVALIQQNIDPWRGGYPTYEKALNILLELSEKAKKENPDIIIWSETSFVPAIDYHLKYKEINDAYILVQRLTDYLKKQEIPFLIGNGEGQKIHIGTSEERRIDFNASLLFINGRQVDIYRKIKLVPFTETFPYQQQFPGIYKMLKEADTHFWEKGDTYTVFKIDSFQFSTPICFEDTFGDFCRNFVLHGADVLVNITNDGWSNSVTAEVQHSMIALFRAVENRKTLVRSANSGITAAIDPNGRIIKSLAPFTEDYLIVDIPIYKNSKTLYTLWGDWFPISCGILLICLSFSLSFAMIFFNRKK